MDDRRSAAQERLLAEQPQAFWCTSVLPGRTAKGEGDSHKRQLNDLWMLSRDDDSCWRAGILSRRTFWTASVAAGLCTRGVTRSESFENS